MSSDELIVATTNEHKVREIRSLLGDAVSSVRGTHDWAHLDEVEETGQTFRENAELKAEGYHKQINRPVLAEDSGLCVSALGGKPGVHSARFAGPDASAEANNQKLLDELKDVPDDSRDAHFKCCIVLYYTEKLIITAVGTCAGTIMKSEHGSGGFGYDPLFKPDGYDRTFGEMSSAEKHDISHRSDAVRQLDPLISSGRGKLWPSNSGERRNGNQKNDSAAPA